MIFVDFGNNLESNVRHWVGRAFQRIFVELEFWCVGGGGGIAGCLIPV